LALVLKFSENAFDHVTETRHLKQKEIRTTNRNRSQSPERKGNQIGKTESPNLETPSTEGMVVGRKERRTSDAAAEE